MASILTKKKRKKEVF